MGGGVWFLLGELVRGGGGGGGMQTWGKLWGRVCICLKGGVRCERFDRTLSVVLKGQ